MADEELDVEITDERSEPGTSPVPSALTFAGAVQAVATGKKVARAVWPEGTCMLRASVTSTGWPTGQPTGEYLALRLPSGKIDAFIIGAADFDGTDWAVVREN
jgi:hypothetical protein